MNDLYKTVGVSKQAVHQRLQRQVNFDNKVVELVKAAERLREKHPGCGVEKMYVSLNPGFIGRDRFIDLFMDLGFRLKRKRNYRRTTYAGKTIYANLIKGLLINTRCKVWQSDITYIEAGGRFYYAVFIIDVYTKKIVGYEVSDNMRAGANIKALKKALANHPAPDIHHSDRGSQYGCKVYISLLNSVDCQISMALSAQDNAYAERVNRTIKEEYLNHWKPQSFQQLKKQLQRAVYHYNHHRPHNNIGRLSPVFFEEMIKSELQVNPVMSIFDNQFLT